MINEPRDQKRYSQYGTSRWRVNNRQPIENRALVFVMKMIMEMMVVVMLKLDGNVMMVTVTVSQ